ncbi:MAG: hypothetical protein ACRDGS_12315 [Chloroflexota bacterium]
MKYYADVVESLDLLDIGARLRENAGHLDAEQAGGRLASAADLARDGLILAGMREQAIADSCLAGPAVLAAQQGTDWWANRLMSTALDSSAQGIAPDMRVSPAGDSLNRSEPSVRLLAEMGKLPTVVPEGYLFYGLFPEVYGALGHSLAVGWTGRPVVVVGVRSIGTSLSAAVSAGLRLGGCPVVRHTVRPTGDPFQRELVPDRSLMDHWQQAAASGAQFVAVDEGPGLSGSSLAAVVQAFLRAGAMAERVTIVCADPPNHLPQASEAVRRLWETTAVHAARPLIDVRLKGRLAGLLSSSTGLPLTVLRDLSWGGWRVTTPPLLPHQERRKLLLWDGERRVLAKFVGFGEYGQVKARLAQRLASEGWSPAYRGFAHGFLLSNWEGDVGGARDDQAARQAVLDAAPPYYAYLRRHCPAKVGVDFAELERIVADTGMAWLGRSHAGLVRRMAAAAAGAGPRALLGDQRPEPVEWVGRGSAILKCDAADHFLDHSWARNQDIAFDLAGFMELWAITDQERGPLLNAYVSLSADPGVFTRLPLFRAVFAAHRLAMLDTAYHAGGSDPEGALDAERRRMGRMLAASLTEPSSAPCG